MPLFEFVCNECNHSFEDLVRTNDRIEDVICPFCGKDSATKKISTFATNSSSNQSYAMSGGNLSTPSCSSGST